MGNLVFTFMCPLDLWQDEKKAQDFVEPDSVITESFWWLSVIYSFRDISKILKPNIRYLKTFKWSRHSFVSWSYLTFFSTFVRTCQVVVKNLPTLISKQYHIQKELLKVPGHAIFTRYRRHAANQGPTHAYNIASGLSALGLPTFHMVSVTLCKNFSCAWSAFQWLWTLRLPDACISISFSLQHLWRDIHTNSKQTLCGDRQ